MSVFLKEKKWGACANGLLGSVLTPFHKSVTSVFLLPAQFEVQINSVKLPSQNRAQEQVYMLCRFNLFFL